MPSMTELCPGSGCCNGRVGAGGGGRRAFYAAIAGQPLRLAENPVEPPGWQSASYCHSVRTEPDAEDHY